MTPPKADPKDQLLDAALMHVPFDGWSPATFNAAIKDSGLDPALARAVCPRGAVDLAVAYHRRGDAKMLEGLAQADLSELRFRDRIAKGVRLRLEAGDREAIRRGSTLFALPHHAPEGAGLIWETSDKIWTALGDTSDDVNWYSKRATLSGVYSATLLYWLGDASEGHQATWSFLDRRIDDVMQIEKLKAQGSAD
jgi:ubiquinone biosynthesis protein COQ9